MFEFDVNKSQSNLEKHGIYFETACSLWKDPKKVEVDARTIEEKRHLLIAKLEGKIWTAVSTRVEENIRIISVRRARNYEKEIYFSGGV